MHVARRRTRSWLKWLAVAAMVAIVAPACSCGDPSSSVTSPGGSSAGGGGSGGDTGQDGDAGQGGTGGEGGSPAASGMQVSDIVNAGEHVSSPSYSMVFTMGQPSQHQGTMTSPSYRLQGGLIGAMGMLP